MRNGGWRELTCPGECDGDHIVALLLPRRQLFLCMCKQCKTVWLDSPHGAAVVTRDELMQLQRLRKRYLAGELRR